MDSGPLCHLMDNYSLMPDEWSRAQRRAFIILSPVAAPLWLVIAVSMICVATFLQMALDFSRWIRDLWS
jgi:hypothetical protein